MSSDALYLWAAAALAVFLITFATTPKVRADTWPSCLEAIFLCWPMSGRPRSRLRCCLLLEEMDRERWTAKASRQCRPLSSGLKTCRLRPAFSRSAVARRPRRSAGRSVGARPTRRHRGAKPNTIASRSSMPPHLLQHTTHSSLEKTNLHKELLLSRLQQRRLF